MPAKGLAQEAAGSKHAIHMAVLWVARRSLGRQWIGNSLVCINKLRNGSTHHVGELSFPLQALHVVLSLARSSLVKSPK